MKDAASIFSGTHDFRYFADEERGKSTLCDIKTISIRNDGDWFYLDIAGNRFMQHISNVIDKYMYLTNCYPLKIVVYV